jgi:hypothetical protein
MIRDFQNRFDGYSPLSAKKRFRVVVGGLIIIGACLGLTQTVLANQRSGTLPVTEPGTAESPTLGKAVVQTRGEARSRPQPTEPIGATTVPPAQPTASTPAAGEVDPEPYDEDFEPTCLVSSDGSVSVRLQVASDETLSGSIRGSDGVQLGVEGEVGNSQFHLRITDVGSGSSHIERWWLLEDGVELPDGSSLIAVMCDDH